MKLSIVDVSTVLPGETRRDALLQSIELAKHAEKLGFNRIWLAEHHGSGSIAGRAPEVLIAAIAANTSTIRVGSGSVLLNHYSAFKVAEVFCTLNELYPGRIDLGAGRASTNPVTDYALQQNRTQQFHSDPNQQIAELVNWLDNSFPADNPFSEVPLSTIDSLPEVHLLGSSPWSASAAAQLGMRYVLASFINQRGTAQMINAYRTNFKPSMGKCGIKEPEVMLAAHVVCAETEAEARLHLAPVILMNQNLAKGIHDATLLEPLHAVKELGGLPQLERYSKGTGIPPKFIAGTPEQVRKQLSQLAADLSLDEIMIQDMIMSKDDRFLSYSLLADAFDIKS